MHREVLAWKYLRLGVTNRQMQAHETQTIWNIESAAAYFGIRHHVVLLGPEMVAKGDTKEKRYKMELKSDGGIWQLWLDDKFKVVRISIPSENTEVVRD